jgi:glycosyltransferase involved in cell wall biosynthesis
MKLAIFSPSNNALTETFIQAHREIPGMDILFYYGGVEHAKLEGKGSLLDLSLATRIKKKLVNKLAKYNLTATQEAVAESLMAEGIECVLAEYGPSGVHILPMVKATGIPLVVHFHGYDAVRHDVIQELGNKYREMFDYASSVIAVSKVMYQKLLDLGCPEEKLVLNTYGPHPDFAKVEAEHTHQHFVGLGRFTDKKAPYYTILAFRDVIEEFPGARLTLAGDGPLLDVCKNLVRYYKLEQFVKFPGPIQREKYIEMLKTCRAYVQHSLTPGSGDMEGTPLSILEAQSAGVPVISTNHAGIPDVVVHDETGLLSDEHDVQLMTEHMKTLLAIKNLAGKMGDKAKVRIQENYSLQRHLDRLAEVIVGAIGD